MCTLESSGSYRSSEFTTRAHHLGYFPDPGQIGIGAISIQNTFPIPAKSGPCKPELGAKCNPCPNRTVIVLAQCSAPQWLDFRGRYVPHNAHERVDAQKPNTGGPVKTKNEINQIK